MGSTFWTMLRKNLMIVAVMSVLMALLCCIIGQNENTRLKKELAQGVEDGLENFEFQLAAVQSAFFKAYEQEDIASLMRMDGEPTPYDYYKIKRSQEYVSSLAFANAYAHDMMLFMRVPHILLTKYASFLTAEDYQKHYQLNVFELSQDMLQKKSQIAPGFIASSFRSSYDTRSVSAIIHYFSASSFPGSNNLLVFAVYDIERVLKTILPIELPADSRLCLTDTAGTALIEKNAEKPWQKDAEIIVQSRLFKLEWALSPSWMKQQSGPLSSMAALFAVLAFVLGLVMSIFAAVKQARPVKLLLLADEEKSKRSREEMNFVREEILCMNQQHQDVIKQLKNTQTALMHNMIERLLFSKDLGTADLEEISEYIGDFPDAYCVCFGKILGDTPTARAAFMHAIRTRRPNSTLFHQLDPEAFALVWGLKEGQTQASAVQEAQKMLVDLQFGPESPIRMVVSQPAHGVENVAAAFSQARRAFFQTEQWGTVCVMCAQPPQFSAVGLHDFSALYRALVSGSAEQSKALLTQAYGSADLDSESLYYTLRTTLVLAARDSLKQHAVQPPVYSRGLNRQLEALLQKADEITACVNEEKKSHNHTLKQDILEYIDNNFSDPELYGRSLADKFHISEKYLYNFIKEQTGSSMGELIMNLRLNQAIELLQKSDLPVGQIGAKVGFVSQNTFYKAFKREFGLSPTEYRQREKEGGCAAK